MGIVGELLVGDGKKHSGEDQKKRNGTAGHGFAYGLDWGWGRREQKKKGEI